MSNYIKTVDFAAKDALTTGNPAKAAKGTEVDTEFNNIATAVATKADSSTKGQANGIAPLDGSAKVPTTNLPSTIVYTTTAPVYTQDVEVSKTSPQFILFDATQATTNKGWGIRMVGTVLYIGNLSDDLSTISGVITLTRSAGVTNITIGNPGCTVNILGTLKSNGTTMNVP